MIPGRLSRRRFLKLLGALGGAAAAGRLPGGFLRAAEGPALRIGFIGPTRTGLSPVAAATYQTAGGAAYKAAWMAGETFSQTLERSGQPVEVLATSAPGPEAARRAAERMILRDGVSGIVGGFGDDTCRILSQVAETHQVPFFNVACASDSLRGARCSPYTFHVEASAAMYLDALADWFVPKGVRRWFFVAPDSEEGRARLQRARRAILQRHGGTREAGVVLVPPDASDFIAQLPEIRRARADMVLLLLDAVAQLDFLGQYDAQGLSLPVTGFPDAVSQTRTWYAAARKTAPRSGAATRVALWEATLEGSSARELNRRFLDRWGQPMDPSAWAAWQAVKILRQAALAAGSIEGPALVRYLESSEAVFDVGKGVETSFRPWDHQLRQPLFVIEIQREAQDTLGLARVEGQVPALPAGGRAATAALDRVGDSAASSRCRLTTRR